MHVWIVEAKSRYNKIVWRPVLGYRLPGGMPVEGVWRTRKLARDAARQMSVNNFLNTPSHTSVRYRAVKYTRK